jgi:hypothetical protein
MSKPRRHTTPSDCHNPAEHGEMSQRLAAQEQLPLEERSQRRFGTSTIRRRHSRRGGAPAMFARAGAQAGDGAGHFFARLDHTTLAYEREGQNTSDTTSIAEAPATPDQPCVE